MKVGLPSAISILVIIATGCMTHQPEAMGNMNQKLDMSSFFLPTEAASRIVSVRTNVNAAVHLFVQTHAVATKESGPKETVAKFGEVYAFSPNFFVVHRDEPTDIHFLNLQPDDNHDFMLFAPDQVFLKILLPPLKDTSYVFTFHREGLFNFICAMHQPSMNGQILVLPPESK